MINQKRKSNTSLITTLSTLIVFGIKNIINHIFALKLHILLFFLKFYAFNGQVIYIYPNFGRFFICIEKFKWQIFWQKDNGHVIFFAGYKAEISRSVTKKPMGMNMSARVNWKKRILLCKEIMISPSYDWP